MRERGAKLGAMGRGFCSFGWAIHQRSRWRLSSLLCIVQCSCAQPPIRAARIIAKAKRLKSQQQQTVQCISLCRARCLLALVWCKDHYEWMKLCLLGGMFRLLPPLKAQAYFKVRDRQGGWCKPKVWQTRMYMCTLACKQAQTHICARTHMRTRLRTQTHTHAHAHTHTYTQCAQECAPLHLGHCCESVELLGCELSQCHLE